MPNCTIVIKAHVPEYLLELALPEIGRTEPRNHRRDGGKAAVGRSAGFSNSSFTLLPFGGLTAPFQAAWNRSFGRLKPYFSSDHQMWYVLTSCRTSPGYATTPARSESPTAEAPLSGIAALPARERAAHLGEGLSFSFILGCCCTALRWAHWLIVGGEMVTN